MKKVLYILNDSMRQFTYERTAGLYLALKRLEEPVDLYIVRSDGYTDFSPEHNYGEYNIFRLPDYSCFDGIVLDINSNFNKDANTYAVEGIRYAIEAAVASGKSVISMANDLQGITYVGIDNYRAMQSVVRYLHQDQGIRDFWFAMGPPDNFENRERTRGLKEYCMENEIPCGDDRFFAESFVTSSGIRAFETLSARHGGALPQAVICANDAIALGVCYAAQNAGFDVPGDLMVTGFDNSEVSVLSPSITTVDQKCWKMGDICADTLRRLWQGESVPDKIIVPTELVLRESTGQESPGGKGGQQIQEYMQHSSKASDYSYRLSALQYQLPGCKSIEEIGSALVKCLSGLKCQGASLVLDSILFDGGGMLQLDEEPERVGMSPASFPVEGYSDRMEAVFSWDAGLGVDCRRQPIGHSLFVSDKGYIRENYIFSPLHFRSHAVGYLIIRDGIDLIRIKGVSSIVNTLTMALRSYFYEKKLAYMNRLLSGISRKDELTGLCNRLGYHDLAYPMFRNECAFGRRIGVIFMDMDGLKMINDTFGHTMGDLAIRCISKAILNSVPEEALAVRYGGDEFLVLLPDADETRVRALLGAIHASLAIEAVKMGVPDFLDLSAGFVISDLRLQKTLDEYVREADELMYREKRAKKKQRT